MTSPSSLGIISLYFDEDDEDKGNPDALHTQCLKIVKDSSWRSPFIHAINCKGTKWNAKHSKIKWQSV